MPRFTVNYEDEPRPPVYHQPPPPPQQQQSLMTIPVPLIVVCLIGIPIFFGMGRPVIFAPTSAPPVNIFNNNK